MPTAPGLLPRAARLRPEVGKAVVALFRFTPVPAPGRVVTAVLGDGRRMAGRLDDHTQRKVLFGVYEPDETALVAAHLRPGDLFVDVGANIGWFATLAAGIVGPTGQVHAFEPFPANARLLKRNVAALGVEHVTVHQAAASDAAGTLSVGRQGTSDSGSVTAGPWGTEDSVEVATVRLDDVVPPGEVGLVKIDVEGFEASVLAGAPELLRRTRAVLIELNRDALEVAGSSPEALIGLLRDAGLTDLRLVEDPAADVDRPVDFANLLAVRP